MKPKILIIGPIEDFGGREMEAGFIAEALSIKYHVDICSTTNISQKSQVYEFNFNGNITSIKQEVFKKHRVLRALAYLSFVKNKKKEPRYYYVNNNLSQKLGFQKKEQIIIFDLLSKYDGLFILANLETFRTKEIISFSKKLNKKVIFRTTGEIRLTKYFPKYLNEVSVFLHHSESNAISLHNCDDLKNYKIIDQTAQHEHQLLLINQLSKTVTKFGVISRISRGKNIEVLINYFLKSAEISDKLYIIGDGELKDLFIKKYKDHRNIFFQGYISNENLHKVFENFECLIIPSASEAGPFVGVEAMAAGKIILSTETGAMPDRLKNTYNNFWFQADNGKSFEQQFNRIKSLMPSEVFAIGEKNRIIYNQNYSKRNIAEKYRNAVYEILTNRSEICL